MCYKSVLAEWSHALLRMRDGDPSWEAVLSDEGVEAWAARTNAEFAERKEEWFKEGARWFDPRHALFYGRRLRDNFGSPFLWMLASVYLGVKGLMLMLLELVALPLFVRHYGVSIERYQSYLLAVMTPWSLKPLIGLVSDLVPIGGWNKLPYILAATAVGTGCLVRLASTLSGERHGNQTAAAHAAIMIGGASGQAAVTDLLTEGKYAELMGKRPATAGDLTSFVSLLFFGAGIVAAAIAGPLADAGRFAAVVWTAVVPSAQVVAPIAAGCFPERRRQPGDPRTPVPWRYVAIAVCMAGSSLGLTYVNIQNTSPGPKVAAALCSGIGLAVLSCMVLPTVLARCNLYMFLSTGLYFSLTGALDAFYTAGPDCIADAPHFSMTYYLTASTVVGSVAGVVAVAVFQSVMRDWPFRQLFWAVTLLKVAAAVVDVVIVLRWNARVGLSDKATYMMGHNIAGSFIAQLDWMPAVVLTTKLCPRGLEATVYALLAGFQNYGVAIATSLGTALTSAVGVQAVPSKGMCQFERLPALILLCHVVIPLMVLPLTFVLIPNARMTDTVVL